MVSKNLLKLIRSLEHKKFRKETGLFVAEGGKLVSELLPFFECDTMIATGEWLEGNSPIAQTVVAADSEEVKRCSLQVNRQDVVALFRQKEMLPDYNHWRNELVLVLDTIQDPGNMGTILRVADWFGITTVICSPDTADIYNPKTVQSTMGALGRVHVYYCPLEAFFDRMEGVPVYGTVLDGIPIYEETLSTNGIILMGNEGRGISPSLLPRLTKKLYIPSYPSDRPTVESLNVAVATSIVCAEFRRRG